MSYTDYLGLSEHKIFKEACASLPKNLTKTLNLLTVRDGVLYTWDFQNNCVLTLNVKAARTREGDNVIHQKLLSLRPQLFTPEFLVCNESGTFLAICGPNGVNVLEIPKRIPPYGAFLHNKQVVYCKNYPLDERLLSCSEVIEVRQAKFHPGSFYDNHILMLTSDNMLRLYKIENDQAVNIALFPVGEKPMGNFPGSTTPFLECYGETAVDFDFGLPEIADSSTELSLWNDNNTNNKSLVSVHTQTNEKIIPKSAQIKNEPKEKLDNQCDMIWPVYILRGNCAVFSMNLDLNKNPMKSKPFLKGPLSLPNKTDDCDNSDACSILCLNTNPQIFCIAFTNGTLCHSILLDMEFEDFEKLKRSFKTVTEVPTKELIIFETVELELGLITNEEDLEDKSYKCPIFLHSDASKVGRYYTTHSAGVHCITLSCADELQAYVKGSDDAEPTSDIFLKPSVTEYLVCTKTAQSEKSNPVVGFSPYYEPPSIVSLLSDGNLVTLLVLAGPTLPKGEDDLNLPEAEYTSPLKKMLRLPIDQYIQQILQKSSTQPILKLSSSGTHTQEQCYEVLQRAAQVFRDDYFKHYTKAREELEKRIQALQMMKKDQLKDLKRMEIEKQMLQENAGSLAEKYEDIKDKQDELLKRCEKLLMLVARRREKPSDAEKEFLKEVNEANDKLTNYYNVIDKVKAKLKYQQIQIDNWKSQETKKVYSLNETHENTIKTNLQESTKKINDMMEEVKEFKQHLNLK